MLFNKIILWAQFHPKDELFFFLFKVDINLVSAILFNEVEW